MLVSEVMVSERLTERKKTKRKLGEVALNWIEKENLGIQDTLTHLYRYLDSGGDAITMAGIEEDLITDIIEKLPNGNFHSIVNFKRDNQDFVSDLENISMRQMVDTNLEIMQRKTRDPDELLRAKQECDEIKALDDWYDQAELGSYIVFESLPVGNQDMAVARIYQKISNDRLSGNFVSLHNPTVDVFNAVRKTFGFDASYNKNSDFLKNYYMLDSSYSVSEYISNYDNILEGLDHEKHRFGLIDNEYFDTRSKIERNKLLLKPYLDLIQIFGNCGGRVNQEVIDFCTELKLELELEKYDCISPERARYLIEQTLTAITNKLKDLKDDISEEDDVYSMVGDSGFSAREQGMTYTNSACPQFTGENIDESGVAGQNESSTLMKSFGLFGYEKLKDFGKAKHGYCRIKNCPNHNKAGIVGGCEICPFCHMMFLEGKKLAEIEKYYQELNDKNIKEKNEKERRVIQKKKKVEIDRLSYKIAQKKLQLKSALDDNNLDVILALQFDIAKMTKSMEKDQLELKAT